MKLMKDFRKTWQFNFSIFESYKTSQWTKKEGEGEFYVTSKVQLCDPVAPPSLILRTNKRKKNYLVTYRKFKTFFSIALQSKELWFIAYYKISILHVIYFGFSEIDLTIYSAETRKKIDTIHHISRWKNDLKISSLLLGLGLIGCWKSIFIWRRTWNYVNSLKVTKIYS